MRHVSDEKRRARLAVRHALAPEFKVDSPEGVVRAMTVLHATEPSTVHLACRARGRSLEVADVDRALYADRRLVKQLAMRRTLFVFPPALLPAAWGSASARVAAVERSSMGRDLVAAGVVKDGERWLERARTEILATLAEHPEGLTALELRKLVPRIAVKVVAGPSREWTGSRVLVYLGARGDIVRGANESDWRGSRPRWTLTEQWIDPGEPLASAAGYRELVRRWLETFGPGTEEDIVWWLGSTKTAVREALAELDAIEVSLDGGAVGLLLPDDLESAPDPGPWVALLPVLDPTVMGWRGRDFYLGPHRDALFDRAGNAGTTAWVDGRIVGCWVQDEDGVVEVRPLERLPARAREALEAEAARLTDWLAGVRLASPLRSPAMADADRP